ncbi:hypothetical protein EPO33_00975 [Patescibacteria group bacterium]|nr:MAG: hypothetical protein EPO33_00975 [Patescibacteria group bacterium]
MTDRKFVSMIVLVVILLYGCTIWLLVGFFSVCLKDAISYTGSSIQAVAIILGGIWGYKRFGWDKKVDNAAKVRAQLKTYEEERVLATLRAVLDVSLDSTERDQDQLRFYKLAVLPLYNKLVEGVSFALLPKKLRKDILDTLSLSISARTPLGHETSINTYSQRLKDINDKLDALISY